MTNQNLIFERMILRAFRKSIRPFLNHLPKDCFKGAYAWKLSGTTNTQWEITMPAVGHVTIVNAHSAYGAKTKVFEEYVENNMDPEIYKEYCDQVCS